jgi:hypothetical protein
LTFVDFNIPMYLIGAAHPRKADAQVLLERLIAASERIVTDAEVLQEIPAATLRSAGVKP